MPVGWSRHEYRARRFGSGEQPRLGKRQMARYIVQADERLAALPSYSDPRVSALASQLSYSHIQRRYRSALEVIRVRAGREGQ